MRQLLTEMRKILPKPKVAGSNPVCRSSDNQVITKMEILRL